MEPPKNTQTFETKYGKITLYTNEHYIGNVFKSDQYWDEENLLKLKQYIDPNRNILEIGGHCGTSTVLYASFLNPGRKVYVYEPQKKMYELLVYNINQNNLQDKIVPFHAGVFCYNGVGHMNDIDLDGPDRGVVENRYTTESDLPCNFGGISLGRKGEFILLVTVDDMFFEDVDIGYIHCDAQGAENYIFSCATNTLTKNRPVIFYENNCENIENGRYLFDNVYKNYPEYEENSRFNVRDFCMNKLGYSNYIRRFDNGNDDLLIP